MQPPIVLLSPCAAPKLPHQNIIFKLIALIECQPREVRAQVREYIVYLPAAAYDLIRRGDERRQGFGEKVGFSRRVKRHAVACKGAFERKTVIVKATHRNGDIPPAAARVTHEGYRTGCGKLAFSLRIRCGLYINAGGVPLELFR